MQLRKGGVVVDDLFNRINPRPAIAPNAAITDNTPAVSGWIDRQGYDSLTFLILSGLEADADATFAVTLQHADADDQSDAAAVAATDILGTLALASFTFSDDNKCFKLGYVGGKRYTKITITPSNNAGNFYASVIALLGDPDLAPTPNPPA
jgi:hypothetical protein